MTDNRKDIRCCFIGTLAPPPGGAALQCTTTAELLAARNVDVVFVDLNFHRAGMQPPKGVYGCHTRGNAATQLRRVLARPIRFLSYVTALWAERDVIGSAREVVRFANLALIVDEACARSGPVNIIHVHNAGIRGMCALAVAKRLDVPLAITVYSSEFGDEVANVPLAARCCARADAVIGISQFCLDMVKEAGVDRAMSLVYCGTDYDRFRPDIDTSGVRDQYGIGSDDVLILTAGWLSYRKGQDLLVEAAALLAEEQRLGKAYILFCGPSTPNDPFVEDLKKRIAASGMEKRVQLAGEVSADDLLKLYAAADVFVFPTRLRTEGFGLVATEAMACGTPVVASRVGAIPEVVRDGETGLLFEPDDVGDLADKLGTLLDDPGLRAELAANAPEHVRTHFSWDEAARRIEAIYRQCLEQRR